MKKNIIFQNSKKEKIFGYNSNGKWARRKWWRKKNSERNLTPRKWKWKKIHFFSNEKNSAYTDHEKKTDDDDDNGGLLISKSI